MQPTHNTLSESIRAQSVELLNKHLAAAIDLHAQVKQAHWNMRGPGFIAVHELFDKVSEEVENYSDLIAERGGGLVAPRMALCRSRRKTPSSSPMLSISPTKLRMCSLFPGRSRRSVNPYERPSIKQPLSAMWTLLICLPKSRAALTAALGGRVSYCAEKMRPSTPFSDALSNHHGLHLDGRRPCKESP